MHPRIVIGVPSEITQVEKRAVIDSAYRARSQRGAFGGAGHEDGGYRRRACLSLEPSSNMVVDIGGGTTDTSRHFAFRALSTRARFA